MNIPFGRQDVNEDGIAAVTQALKLGYLSQSHISPQTLF